MTRSRAALLAVSGGPDSTALMHLAAAAAALADPASPPPAVATVDHGLRPGSRAEAESVAAAAAALGLPHHLLTWDGPKPTARLQERARAARYALLVGCARRIGATHLATAHTLDDQAETVLFRMMRGSGLAGLAGMAREVARDGVVHVRPFLAVPKSRLVAACTANGWPAAEDPGNADTRFARARLRALMPALAEEGLDAPRFATLARRAAEAEAALATMAARTASAAARPDGAWSMAALMAEPEAVRLRALAIVVKDGAAALTEAGAAAAPPRSDRLARLERLSGALSAAAAAGDALRRSFGGMIVALDRAGRLTLSAAPPRRTPPT